MSVSGEPRAPEVQDYEMNEILDYLQEEYDLSKNHKVEDEFGVSVQELISLVAELEPSESDYDRAEEILEREVSFAEDYEEEGDSIVDPSNSDAWYMWH